MKRKLFRIVVIIIFMLSIVTFIAYPNNKTLQNNNSENIVLLNEIKELSKKVYEENNEEALNKLLMISSNMQVTLRGEMESSTSVQTKFIVLFMYFSSLFVIVITFIYIYFRILKPFQNMKHFTDEIAKGNFEETLNYNRGNYFGEFTWAFDHMRREIIKSRTCEKEAIENNKTVIATLSHDIKTPIASIRAYSEALSGGFYENVEVRNRYLDVIRKKCDEVSKLTNDLFIHSISDLNKLKMTFEKVDISKLIKEVLCVDAPNKILKLDERRMVQVLENLINNVKKYGGGIWEALCFIKDNSYVIEIIDKGEGISDEDLPFIFEKFYRGKNSINKEGAGLGLYIVKYIIEQHNGGVFIENYEGGAKVTIKLPLS